MRFINANAGPACDHSDRESTLPGKPGVGKIPGPEGTGPAWAGGGSKVDSGAGRHTGPGSDEVVCDAQPVRNAPAPSIRNVRRVAAGRRESLGSMSLGLVKF